MCCLCSEAKSKHSIRVCGAVYTAEPECSCVQGFQGAHSQLGKLLCLFSKDAQLVCVESLEQC